ncbi:hypothetical protein [Roseivivax lentus]|nr:hypothetical protein [Roseivivax lentus]
MAFGAPAVARRLTGGIPTLYLILDGAPTLTPGTGDPLSAGDALLTATAVSFGLFDQGRAELDTAAALQNLVDAMTAAGDTAAPTAGTSAVADLITAIAGDITPSPMLVLDTAGRRVRAGSFRINRTGGAAAIDLSLDPADDGDLQQALSRARAGDPTLPADLTGLGAGASIEQIAPVPGAAQWAAFANPARTGAAPFDMGSNRHFTTTDLHDWFPAQDAVPTGAAASPLQRFTKGNRITTFLNGPPYFDDLFAALHAADAAGGGVHLAGYSMYPGAPLIKRRWNDDLGTDLSISAADNRAGAGDVPVTLEQANARISSAGQGGRFLPLRFINSDDLSAVTAVEILVVHVLGMTLMILNIFGVRFARMNTAGIIVLMAVILTNAIIISILTANGAAALEPSKDAVDRLDGQGGVSEARLDGLPVSKDDNPLVDGFDGALNSLVFGAVFGALERFGAFHQKIAIVKTPADVIAYCGGIDLNPDRIDDERHLAASPYQDTQIRIDGPAVRDIALTFEQRWTREAGAASPAIATPALADLPTSGTMIAQVARTYPQARAAARGLDFAPQGDATLVRGVLAAIAAAREYIFIEDQYMTPPPVYRAAMVQKVANREIKSMIICVPNVTDQPFGEEKRNAFIADLIAADAGAGIVKVGYPRQQIVMPSAETGAMQGKLRLTKDVDVGDTEIFVTPQTRVPATPFWLSVGGEIMRAYDDVAVPLPDPGDVNGAKGLQVDRGADTRITAGPPTPAGASPRKHKEGDAASIVNLAGIYVHSKLMIIDDVYLNIGSANVNRRGYFHDAECNVLTLPEALRSDPRNTVAKFRTQLWAEMLDLPYPMSEPILRDPVASSALFDRNQFLGNRFVPLEAMPHHLVFGAVTGDSVAGALLTSVTGLGVFTLGTLEREAFFDAVVDPTTDLEDRV